MTTVFAAWVTTSGQAWADFDMFMAGRWETDLARRRAAGIPRGLGRKTKPQLAEDQMERLLKACLPGPPVGSLRGSLRAQQRPARGVRGRGPGLRRGHPAGLPDHPAIRRGDQGRRRRWRRGLRAPLVRERVQGAPVRGLGPGRRRRPAAPPADPPPALPAGQPDVYLCWAPGDQPATMTFFITIAERRWPCEEKVQDRKGRPGLGPGPGPDLGRDLSAHRPGRARPAPRCRHPQRPVRRHHPPATRHRAGAREKRRRSATLTWASPSATRPSPPGPGSPARPASAPSSSPSPRPPA